MDKSSAAWIVLAGCSSPIRKRTRKEKMSIAQNSDSSLRAIRPINNSSRHHRQHRHQGRIIFKLMLRTDVANKRAPHAVATALRKSYGARVDAFFPSPIIRGQNDAGISKTNLRSPYDYSSTSSEAADMLKTQRTQRPANAEMCVLPAAERPKELTTLSLRPNARNSPLLPTARHPTPCG